MRDLLKTPTPDPHPHPLPHLLVLVVLLLLLLAHDSDLILDGSIVGFLTLCGLEVAEHTQHAHKHTQAHTLASDGRC